MADPDRSEDPYRRQRKAVDDLSDIGDAYYRLGLQMARRWETRAEEQTGPWDLDDIMADFLDLYEHATPLAERMIDLTLQTARFGGEPDPEQAAEPAERRPPGDRGSYAGIVSDAVTRNTTGRYAAADVLEDVVALFGLAFGDMVKTGMRAASSFVGEGGPAEGGPAAAADADADADADPTT